ncbi:MAG: SDR family oxidoreductase [Bryobacterales bacterium]|jgi:long-chain acyl-CoA synthetase|nr:SDR family oxidoreductase [Bryobacterales bacterium]
MGSGLSAFGSPVKPLSSLRSGALLMSGATGLVGSGLVPLLRSAHPDRDLVLLTRQPTGFPSQGCFVLQADVAKPNLGLPNEVYALLKQQVRQVIHSAADIRFRIHLDESRATNVDGTRHMLEFAEACPHLERFLHVSTIYVAGKRTGMVPERLPCPLAGFVNTYQQTKFEAEQLVLERMSRIPAAIIRLSSIIGDSRLGSVRQFNYFHQSIKAIPWNPLPAIPADPEARIDLVSSDWTIAALHLLFEECFEPGRIHQLCAGADRSWTVGELLNRTYDIFEKHHIHLRLKRRPRLVPYADFERVVEKMSSRLPSSFNEWLGALLSFLPHLSLRQQFENSETEALLAGRVPFPSLDSYFLRVVEYCVSTNWGRAAAD